MTAIERYEPRPNAAIDTIELAPKAWKLATAVANTEIVPKAVRGKPESVLAIILAGAEAGISPMQALGKIHVIEGRIAVSGELMRAQVLAAGHDLWVDELTNTRCTMSGQRAGSPRVSSVTWTIDDARAAGLLGKDPWKRYPRAMLEARATSELCRLLFPDVLAGLTYTPDEIEEQGTLGMAPDGTVVEPVRRTRTRSTAKAGHVATAAPAELPDLPEPPPPGTTSDEIVDADVVEPDPAVEPELGPEPAPVPNEPDPAATSPEPHDPAPPAPSPLPELDEPEEADWYQPEPDPEPRMSGPRLLATRLLATRFNMRAYDRDRRLDLIGELVGREISSTNDLTPHELARVIAVTAAEDYWTTLATEPSTAPHEDPGPTPTAPTGETEAAPSPRTAVLGARRPDPSSSSTTSSDPEVWTADEWRKLISARKLKVSTVMREAARLAAERGARVAVLDDVAGSGIAVDLIGYIEDASL